MLRKLKLADHLLLTAIGTLVLIGFIMVLSVTPVIGLKLFNNSFYFIIRQIVFLFLGFGLFVLALNINITKLHKYAITGIIAAWGVLLLTYVPFLRLTAGGASRWLNLGILSFQPSDIVKIFVILYVAHVVDKRKGIMHNLQRGLLPTVAVVGFVALFVLMQPDLGTTFVILSTTLVMTVVGGANFLEILIMTLLGIRLVSFMMMRNPYQIQRLLTFMDPWKDPLGAGFNTIQSLLAVGSGWIFGVGLGHSSQKFEYLPQQFTDYIFAIICEEGGFLVGSIVIICFALLVTRGIRIALKSEDRFIQLLAVGISWCLGIQACINIMVVTAMMPAKGITLPFISYGGTSLMVCLFLAGILVNLSTTVDNSKKPAV